MLNITMGFFPFIAFTIFIQGVIYPVMEAVSLASKIGLELGEHKEEVRTYERMSEVRPEESHGASLRPTNSPIVV